MWPFSRKPKPSPNRCEMTRLNSREWAARTYVDGQLIEYQEMTAPSAGAWLCR